LARTGGRARRGWRHCAAGGPPSGHTAAPDRCRARPSGEGGKLRLGQQTAALILRATGAAELDPEVLIGLLVTGLEQANLAPVLEAKWRQRGEAALHSEPP
jgi:hypothetical protein